MRWPGRTLSRWARRWDHGLVRGEGAMTRFRVRLSTVVVFGLVGAAIAVGSVSASAAGIATPVITGLNSPRGLTFDSAGSLYVSESGVAGRGAAGGASSGGAQ